MDIETGTDLKVSENAKSGKKEKEYRHDEIPVHVVKKGESLWLIALKELGRGTRYREIMKLNSLETADVSEGQILKMPNK